MSRFDNPPTPDEEIKVVEPQNKTVEKTETKVEELSVEKKLSDEAIAKEKQLADKGKVEEKRSLISRIFKKKELTPEEKQLKLEQRMAKWTPKHEAAKKFLSAVKPGWFDKMGEAQVDKVEEFVKSPAFAGFNSVSYNKEENRYSATGKKEVTSILD